MAAIELFLRSQPDLSNRARHQIRDFYRTVLQEEERDRRAKQIASGDDSS